MANYKVVDADALDSALNSLADSIKNKSGVTGDLAFPEPNDFKSAVDMIVIPTFNTQAKTVQSSRVAQTVQPDSNYDGLSSVTVNAFRYSRIQKTMGSSAATTYSIPLSEIGFTPRIYGFVLYMGNISKGSALGIASAMCDMQNLEETGASTSGNVLGASSTSYDLTTVGTSLVGKVNGNNFTFTAGYGYFRPSGVYRFYFWG